MSTGTPPAVPGRADVVVVGAGAAGLVAAYVLVGAGLDVIVLEARDRVGGRAHSVPVEGGTIDLGATWFWGNEPVIHSLADRLGVPTFAQHLDGDALFEAGTVQRLQGSPIDTPAARFTGGAQHLLDALAAVLPAGTLRLAQPVEAIAVDPAGVRIRIPAGEIAAAHAILALPPALAAESIAFAPDLPPEVRRVAARTAVWMGSMIKAVAVFDTPFWRARGLAGSAMSHRGPFREFHDHSGPQGAPAALFGFAPAEALAGASDRAIAQVFGDQLARLFGPDTPPPRAIHVRNWSAERYTQPVHGGEDMSTFGDPAYARPVHGRLHWASTETAPAFAGHLEGALRSGLRAAEAVRTTCSAIPETDPRSTPCPTN
ncbi:flavin monoamine oxidase family protein [Granulicoccus phenolivorans]|uniref:flavin monoamine oxidase family protein n=1 Tax=Granulicoccus phenolivorans TaxID=266854 RepID=UPI00041EAC27|nr:NAD(P)/FAD-dependent oxidoreductase [Granulicoccus phenolivorans]